jgi:hypothetical protein
LLAGTKYQVRMLLGKRLRRKKKLPIFNYICRICQYSRPCSLLGSSKVWSPNCSCVYFVALKCCPSVCWRNKHWLNIGRLQ